MLTEDEISTLRLRFPILRKKIYLNSGVQGAVLEASGFDLPEVNGPYADLCVELARFVHAEPGEVALINSVAGFADKLDARVFLDGSKDCGTRPVDVKVLNVDFYATDACRYLLGPAGLAFLYSKRPLANLETVAFDPQTLYAARRALAFLSGIGMQNVASQIAQLTRNFMQGLRALGISSPTPGTSAGPLVVLRSNDPTALVHNLAERGIVVSAEQDAVRFSFHVYNNFKDVDAALAVLQANPKLLEVSH